MAKLVVNSESLVSVADAIREKGNTTESLEFPNGFVDGINAIESGSGGTEEIEQIIDQSGVLDSTDGTATEKVEQLIDKAKGEDEQYETLRNHMSNLKLDKGAGAGGVITLDCSKFLALTSLRQTFNTNTSVVTIYLSNTEKITDWYGCFYTVGRLQHIYGDIDMSSATNVQSAFQATNLQTISFVPNTIKISIAFNSSKLSAESIQSIIDGLATVETAQTLTLHKDAKILQSQVDSANAKGWTVAGGTVVSEEEYYG